MTQDTSQTSQKFPQIALDFKTAYDAMDSKAIGDLFAESVSFQATSENEYEEMFSEEVAAYFQKIMDQRQSQVLELVSHKKIGSTHHINAVFQSVAGDGTTNPDKPVHFEIYMSERVPSLIDRFKSEPKSEAMQLEQS